MENNQYTYNQPLEGQMELPQSEMMSQPGMPMRKRVIYGVQRMQDVFPRWLSVYPISAYIIALTLLCFMYSSFSMPWYYIITGVISILIFFLYGSKVVSDNSINKVRKEKRFERRIFAIAFIPRVLFMLLLYWIFMSNYGDAFGFENADPTGYDNTGYLFKEAMSSGRFIEEWKNQQVYLDVSDLGYAAYIGLIYLLTGCNGVSSYDGIGADSVGIIAVRLLKCIWSALTVVLIYRLSKRNFGTQSGRIAAIFCALWPNFWYYCGTHLKEVEMVFLAVLFVEQADQMLRSRQFTAWKIIPILLIAAALFTFRTVLAFVCVIALLFAIVMSSTKVVNWGKRIIIGGLAIALIAVVAGNRIEERAMGLIEQVQGGYQKGNMEWRANRKDASGNTQSFARYAGAAVFAPMILTLPFPTMVRPYEGQEVQQLLNGSNFVKNIMSCFVIFALIILLMSGKWREHVLPLSFMLGYLVVLVMSAFAHSERFHEPAMPFEFMFAAYGLSIAVTKKKYKRWFTYWCVLMFVAALAWNWFKLAGRGLL